MNGLSENIKKYCTSTIDGVYLTFADGQFVVSPIFRYTQMVITIHRYLKPSIVNG